MKHIEYKIYKHSHGKCEINLRGWGERKGWKIPKILSYKLSEVKDKTVYVEYGFIYIKTHT